MECDQTSFDHAWAGMEKWRDPVSGLRLWAQCAVHGSASRKKVVTGRVVQVSKYSICKSENFVMLGWALQNHQCENTSHRGMRHWQLKRRTCKKPTSRCLFCWQCFSARELVNYKSQQHAPDTMRLRRFHNRNSHPFDFLHFQGNAFPCILHSFYCPRKIFRCLYRTVHCTVGYNDFNNLVMQTLWWLPN